MKKTHVAAAIGTIAIMANIILPGFAFAQETQTGSATIACSGSDITFDTASGAPDDFSFADTSGNTTITSSASATSMFSNGVSTELGNAAGAADRHVVIDSPDNFTDVGAGCNNDGFTVDVKLNDNADADGKFFDNAPSVGTGDKIPVTSFKVLTRAGTTSSAVGCPSGFTPNTASTICFSSGALCNNGAGVAVSCDAHGSAPESYTGALSGFHVTGNYSTDALATAGTPDVENPVVILSFPDGGEVLGKAAVGAAYTVSVPAAQPDGTYEAVIVYTLVNL